MYRMMEKMIIGNANFEDIDKLIDVTKQVEGHTICALGVLLLGLYKVCLDIFVEK